MNMKKRLEIEKSENGDENGAGGGRNDDSVDDDDDNDDDDDDGNDDDNYNDTENETHNDHESDIQCDDHHSDKNEKGVWSWCFQGEGTRGRTTTEYGGGGTWDGMGWDRTRARGT